jgi:hypothetical protein
MPIMLALLVCAPLGLPTASSAQAPAQRTRSFEPVQDTSIFDGSADARTRADGSGEHLWLAVTAEGLIRRALVRFDIGELPRGALVQQVALTLYESRARDEHVVQVHKLQSSWGEGASYSGGNGTGVPAQPGDATWLHRFFPSVFWSAVGADFVATPSAALSVGLPNQTYTWAASRPASGPVPLLLQDVQDWVDAPEFNHGWILIGVENVTQNAKRFESRNNAVNRPLLTVTYLEPVAGTDIPVPPWALALLAGAVLGVRLFRRAGPSS